jgi:bifunctional non-homologous end joining protein LigD
MPSKPVAKNGSSQNQSGHARCSGTRFKGAERSPVPKIPTNVKPMLATLVDSPFDRPGWLFEIKWDGYRTIAEVGERVRLYSRNQLSFTGRFRTIVSDLETLGHQAVLDGEIVIVGADGTANFDALQDYRPGKTEGTLVYYVFDLPS